MFTDKAKEKFEAWYIDTDYYSSYSISNFSSHTNRCYYDLPLSMKWGVILEFADSLGYYVTTEWLGENKFYFSIDSYAHYYESTRSNTRKEAQQEAIKKLNQLINKDYDFREIEKRILQKK